MPSIMYATVSGTFHHSFNKGGGGQDGPKNKRTSFVALLCYKILNVELHDVVGGCVSTDVSVLGFQSVVKITAYLTLCHHLQKRFMTT